MAAATSSGCPTRPAGTSGRRSSTMSAVMSVSTTPGVTALHVIPLRAISRATVPVRASKPALEAA